MPAFDIEYVIEKAEQHGRESYDTDMEVGDLQTALRAAWRYLTPDARARVLQDLRDLGQL